MVTLALYNPFVLLDSSNFMLLQKLTSINSSNLFLGRDDAIATVMPYFSINWLLSFLAASLTRSLLNA